MDATSVNTNSNSIQRQPAPRHCYPEQQHPWVLAHALASMAMVVTLLLGFASCSVSAGGWFHRRDDSTTPHDSQETLLIQWLCMFVGDLLLAQALGSGLLLLVSFRVARSKEEAPVSSTTIAGGATTIMYPEFCWYTRAAAVTSCLTGLGWTVGSAMLPHNNVLVVERGMLVAMGLLLLGLASASLMVSFWPRMMADRSATTPMIFEDDVTATRMAFAESGDLLVRSDDEEEAESEPLLAASAYRLMEEDPYETTSATIGRQQCCLATLSSAADCSDVESQQLISKEEREEDPLLQTSVPSNNNDNHSADEATGGESSAIIASGRVRGTRRLLQLAAPEVLYLYAGCLVLLIRLPFSLAMPHFVSTTLAALAQTNYPEARHEIQFLLVAGTIDALLDFWGFFLFGYANQRIVRGLRVQLFRRLLSQDVAFFDARSSGELSSRLHSDCSEMAGDLTWFFRFSVESIVRITGIAGYMLVRSPRLGACALGIVPAVAVINKLYGDWLQRNATQVQDALAEANAVAQEALANVRTVLAFAAESKECTRYEGRIERQYLLNVQQLFMTAAYYMVVNTFLINTIVQGTLLWIGMLLIEDQHLTPGVLLAFMLYQSQLQNETMNLMNSYTSLIKSSGAGDKVFALLDRRPPQPSTGFADGETDRHDDAFLQQQPLATEAADALPEQAKQQLDFVLEKVSFRYPSRPDSLVLDCLDLEIPRGQTLALVGKSGCGKSTIINLLQRFYDPTQGRILVNGVDLRAVNLHQHRRHIGVVTQDPALFRGSLWENISYGCEEDVTDADIVHAAHLAHADTFIDEFPNKYQTAVGERGVQLSGGQKQRVAIARAVALQHGQPSLLLLDEATSALDYASETAVQQALDQLLQENRDMTTVIVAHRLRTVQNADRIVVLQEGRVAEQGTHQDLLKNTDGIYREMVARAGVTGVLPEN